MKYDAHYNDEVLKTGRWKIFTLFDKNMESDEEEILMQVKLDVSTVLGAECESLEYFEQVKPNYQKIYDKEVGFIG